MTTRLFLPACLLVLVSCFAKADTLPPEVVAAFSSANRVLLYSLEPVFHEGSGFHGFRILGYKVISDAPTRQQLADTLQRDVKAGGLGELCFEPRHGLRLINGRTITDLVICYQCGQVHVHAGGQPVQSIKIAGSTAYPDNLLSRSSD